MNAEERGASKEDHAATGEDLDDLDTVDGIDSVDAARMGKAAHVLARVAALERLGGVPAAQSPRLEEDRKLDECGTTGAYEGWAVCSCYLLTYYLMPCTGF